MENCKTVFFQIAIAFFLLGKSFAETPFIVLELFTSEGCSSCPPADKILSDFALHPKNIDTEFDNHSLQIYPLSFHIDYWNRLGWADPFSQNIFTQRQERYAEALGFRVYTPQMVINGNADCVGSSLSSVKGKILKAKENFLQSKEIKNIHLDLKEIHLGLATPENPKASINQKPKTPQPDNQDSFTSNYSISGDSVTLSKLVLCLALVEKGIAVDVRKGENAGEKLRHENVVRIFKTIPNLKSGSGQIEFQIPDNFHLANFEMIGFLQNPIHLQILAAARTNFF